MLGRNEGKSRKVKTELKWEEERRKFFEDRGWEISHWRDGEEKRRRGGVVSELIRKDRED